MSTNTKLSNGCVTGHDTWLYLWSCIDIFTLFPITFQMFNGHFLQHWPQLIFIFLTAFFLTKSYVATKITEFCFLSPVPTMGYCIILLIVAHSAYTFLNPLPYLLVPKLSWHWPHLSQYFAVLVNELSTWPKHIQSRIWPVNDHKSAFGVIFLQIRPEKKSVRYYQKYNQYATHTCSVSNSIILHSIADWP